MTYKLANHSIRMSLTMLLDGITDVSNALSMNCSLNSYIESFFCDLQQLTNVFCNLTDTKSICGIPAKAIHISSTIHRNDITIFQYHITGYSMHNLFIHRCTY